MKTNSLAAVCLLGAFCGVGNAALIAQYDFTDFDLTDDELGNYNLSLVSNGSDTITIGPYGAAVFPGNDAEPDYLEVTGPGGSPDWTVSFWFRTPAVDQGGWQGLFSNNISPSERYSWQVDSHDGTLRLVGSEGVTITNADAGEPQIQPDVWHHVVARKESGSAELFFGTMGSLFSVGTDTNNPGGLQMFRLGTNRNSNALYAMQMANVKIYNDSSVLLADLNAEGPGLVPEPAALLIWSLLAGLGVGVGWRRRKR